MDKYFANFRAPIADYIDKDLETPHFPHVRIGSYQALVFSHAASELQRFFTRSCKGLPAVGMGPYKMGGKKDSAGSKEIVHVVVTFNSN
jgi:hypothetical protein